MGLVPPDRPGNLCFKGGDAGANVLAVQWVTHFRSENISRAQASRNSAHLRGSGYRVIPQVLQHAYRCNKFESSFTRVTGPTNNYPFTLHIRLQPIHVVAVKWQAHAAKDICR